MVPARRTSSSSACKAELAAGKDLLHLMPAGTIGATSWSTLLFQCVIYAGPVSQVQTDLTGVATASGSATSEAASSAAAAVASAAAKV